MAQHSATAAKQARSQRLKQHTVLLYVHHVILAQSAQREVQYARFVLDHLVISLGLRRVTSVIAVRSRR